MSVLKLAYIVEGANEGLRRVDRPWRLTGLCLACVSESFLYMMKLSHFERGHSTTTLTAGRLVACLLGLLTAPMHEALLPEFIRRGKLYCLDVLYVVFVTING